MVERKMPHRVGGVLYPIAVEHLPSDTKDAGQCVMFRLFAANWLHFILD